MVTPIPQPKEIEASKLEGFVGSSLSHSKS